MNAGDDDDRQRSNELMNRAVQRAIETVTPLAEIPQGCSPKVPG
jgi:hypothetical protein